MPKPEVTPALLSEMETVRVNPFGELPEPLPLAQVGALMQKRDGYQYTPTDQADVERQWPQLKGQFLIDRGGIVRWAYIECATEGLAGLGKMPSDDRDPGRRARPGEHALTSSGPAGGWLLRRLLGLAPAVMVVSLRSA